MYSGSKNLGNGALCGGFFPMWATNLDIETFTEYYHSLKVCTDINLNLVSKFLLPQISIIVNDILNISYLNNV